MDLLTKKRNLEEISIDKFLELHGVTERDITSDRWLRQVESNGYGLYCIANNLDDIRFIWADEFQGERGPMDDNLEVFNVEGTLMAMWS